MNTPSTINELPSSSLATETINSNIQPTALDSSSPKDTGLPKEKRSNSNLTRRVVAKLCYPVLMSVAIIVATLGFSYQLDFGLCNMAFLIFAISYLAVCERIIPYKKEWHPNAKEWGRDGLYLILTMIGGASAVAVVFAIAGVFSPAQPNISLWLEVPAALLLTSLGSYIFHRAGHELPWLWRFHGIHHATHKINVSNNALNHILDVFGRRVLAQLPLILLGLSEPALFIVSLFNIGQGYFSHANVDVKLGKLNYLVGSPEQHRLHHSRDLTEAGHFSVDIPFWDLVFKSYTWKPGKHPKEIGVVNRSSFPESNHIIKNLIHPFRPKGYHLNRSD